MERFGVHKKTWQKLMNDFARDLALVGRSWLLGWELQYKDCSCLETVMETVEGIH